APLDPGAGKVGGARGMVIVGSGRSAVPCSRNGPFLRPAPPNPPCALPRNGLSTSPCQWAHWPAGAAWSGFPVPAPPPPPTKASAAARRYSPATSWPPSPTAANGLSPFPLWPALPAAEYYGDSATPGCHQPTAGLPAAVLAARRGGGPPCASHVHWAP